MRETDEMIFAGDALPTIAKVEKGNGPFDVVVTWATGARAERVDVIDTAPQILTFKIYKPLRNDTDLFSKLTISADRTAIVWPGSADLEISADALEEMAEQVMTCADFADFVKSKAWTLDAAAVQLGLSRRQIAYYLKERSVPRVVALACQALGRNTPPVELDAPFAGTRG